MIVFFSLRRRRRRKARTLIFRDRNLKASLRRSLLYLVAIFMAHVGAMWFFEAMPPLEAVWLTLTTATTVGYGDVSAATLPGRASTVVLLYIGGIFVVAKVAGDYFEYRSDAHARKIQGAWRWNMAGHIVILRTPIRNGEQYFVRLIKHFRASDRYRDHPIEILTREFPTGLPESIRELRGVVHYHGSPDDVDRLKAVNIDDADVVVVLAKDEGDMSSDGRTFDTLHRVSELRAKGTVLAECVDDRNRERLLKAGADIVIRPIRAYPGLIVRTLVAPGSEQVFENLFVSSGDGFTRFDVDVSNRTWSDIACALMTEGIGTAVAYVDRNDGSLRTNPAAGERVDATAIIVIVKAEHIPSLERIRNALSL